ncbi:NUDIX domain-containing protein [Cytobacillus solani]|uniref:NUDIX hydrolase n=1 Tax=Cytobacillus solani TaxID=1637975 RepID=UPI001FE85E6E|nr:NUDIX domain-containing protein [Cytobacillus solani]
MEPLDTSDKNGMNPIFVEWGGNYVKLTWHPRMKITKSIIVTSVHAICFRGGNVLLAHIKNRGFNYPGGHIDPGEKIEEALCREVYEEGYVKGTIQYIGAIEVSHEENPFFDPKGKYPLIAYQVFYRMDITECLPFLREYESITRIWVEPDEVPFVINDHELLKLVLNDALTLNSY